MRQTKVHHFDETFVVQHNIGAFNVSVNDVLLVSSLETLSRLDGDIECFVELEGPVLDHLLDASAVDALHGDEGEPIGLVDLVNGADIGMVECRGRLGFTEKAFLFFFARQLVHGREFQRDRAPQFGVFGLVDDPPSRPGRARIGSCSG